MKLLEGKPIRDKRRQELADVVKQMPVTPKLAIIQVGSREDSNAYIKQKQIFGESIGCVVELFSFPDTVEVEVVVEMVKKLNSDVSVHGIILQLPLPPQIDAQKIIATIDPLKDVDGLTSVSTKYLWENKPWHRPATARGVSTLLRESGISVSGKKVVVVGRSSLVGKPVALLLLHQDATVTIAHSKTPDLASVTRGADILIVATGVPGLITQGYVHQDQVVIDVGINLVTGQKYEEEVPGRLFTGDVLFNEVKDKVLAITPVPGGVGPLTVLSLFENLIDAVKLLSTEAGKNGV